MIHRMEVAAGRDSLTVGLRVAGKGLLLIAGIAALVLPVISQTPSASRRTFEVASIKSNTSGDNRVGIGNQPGGRFVANNASLRMVLRLAFRPLQDFQILGGPSWLDSDRFNIEARDEGGPLSPDEMGPALQSLLEDRFELKTHRETRELPVYTLTVAKDGPKMKAVDPPPPPPGAGARGDPGPGARGGFPPPPPPFGPNGPPANFTPPPGTVMIGRGSVMASAAPMTQLINLLSQQVGRPVIDKTDLKGYYDIRLQFTPGQLGGLLAPGGPAGPEVTPPPAADPGSPTIFTAVQEQLGLKLESTKAPVEVVVIDSVQKPSEN